MAIPETRYPRTVDGAHIPHVVLEDGPGDLVFVPRFEFDSEHELKGVPDRGRLYRVVG